MRVQATRMAMAPLQKKHRPAIGEPPKNVRKLTSKIAHAPKKVPITDSQRFRSLNRACRSSQRTLSSEVARYGYGLAVGIRKNISPGKWPHRTKPDSSSAKAANVLYAELGGSGLLYSINYERRLVKAGKFGANWRLGMAIWPAADNILSVESRYFTPQTVLTGLNFTYGNEHKVEAGATFTRFLADMDPPMDYVCPSVGYRYESSYKNFARASFVIITEPSDGRWFPWMGISYGRRF